MNFFLKSSIPVFGYALLSCPTLAHANDPYTTTQDSNTTDTTPAPTQNLYYNNLDNSNHNTLNYDVWIFTRPIEKASDGGGLIGSMSVSDTSQITTDSNSTISNIPNENQSIQKAISVALQNNATLDRATLSLDPKDPYNTSNIPYGTSKPVLDQMTNNPTKILVLNTTQVAANNQTQDVYYIMRPTSLAAAVQQNSTNTQTTPQTRTQQSTSTDQQTTPASSTQTTDQQATSSPSTQATPTETQDTSH